MNAYTYRVTRSDRAADTIDGYAVDIKDNGELVVFTSPDDGEIVAYGAGSWLRVESKRVSSR